MDTIDEHLLLMKRQSLILLRKPDHEFHFGLLARAEQEPEDYKDMSQGSQPTPLPSGSARKTKAMPG